MQPMRKPIQSETGTNITDLYEAETEKSETVNENDGIELDEDDDDEDIEEIICH